MNRAAIASCLLVALGAGPTIRGAAAADRTRARSAAKLTLERLRREPADSKRRLTASQLAALRRAVKAAPHDRRPRLKLVMALFAAGQLQQALSAARSWRERDAYNLVVVRLIGDIYARLGRRAEALRTYSAVVELLAEDPGAQRALAAVMKQTGQIEAAYQRLAAAARLRPKDQRIGFELADTAQRLGRIGEAERRFSAIAASDAPAAIRYPAKQRLARIYARRRLGALRRKDRAGAAELAAKIRALEVKGGALNDIKVFLSWDSDRTDVDLWVTNPAGEKVYYRHKQGRYGGALFDDVTNGYGPESFTAHRAAAGDYLIEVHYYGTRRRTFRQARGEVIVLLHEGTARERRYVLPYRLQRPKQKVAVARIKASDKEAGSR